MPMNVLVILNYFDRDGGTSKTFTEGKYLAALGVRLVVVVPRNPFAKSDVAAKLRAQGLKYFSAATHFRVLYLLFPFALWKISRIIRREKIDLLHVNHGKALVLGAVLSRMHKVPLVYTINGVTPRELPGLLKNFWFRRVSRVIAVSEESAAHFLSRVRFPAQRVVICRNGVDFAHFQSAVKAADGHLRLLYLSRLDRDKRRAVDAVMEAAARVFSARPQLRLCILGDGRQMGKIERKARAINAGLGRDIITVHGWADDPLAYFAAADVVLGVGRCVLEAIAAGRPVLVVGNERIGGWVTAANFPALQKANFSGRGADTAVGGENLAREFMAIPGEPAGLEKIRALARRDHDAAGLAPALKEIFRQAASCPPPDRGRTP
jgi:glycosyltransferase involved in cell wall biosynthesis